MVPKVCDFGSAQLLPAGQAYLQADFCETTYQVAPPEVLQSFHYYMSCDLWSLGVIAQCMELAVDWPWSAPPLQTEEGEPPTKEWLLAAARAAREHADRVAFQDDDADGSILQGLLF